MTTHDWEALAALYAVDALDGPEEQAFKARLEQDESLGSLVDEWRLAASALGTSLEPVTPDASLRSRTLVRMTGDSTGAAGTDVRRRSANNGASGTDKPQSKLPVFVPWALAATFAAISLGLGLSRQEALGRLAQAEADRNTVTEQLASAEEQLATLDSLLAPLHDTDLRFASLERAPDQPTMRMLWSPSSGRMVFAVNRLPPASPGHTYQLWGIPDGGTPVSLGTFDTDNAGNALELRTPAVSIGFTASAVTEEPIGGSTQPTTTPFLVGNWGAVGP